MVFWIITFLTIFLNSLIGVVKFTPYNQKEIALKIEKSLKNKKMILGDPIFIRIFKESNELEIWIKEKSTSEKHTNNSFHHYKTFPICYHSGTLGPKLKEGDKQAPEGFYAVSASQMNPNSRFHLSFNVGFPNEYDQRQNRTGSHLMVHGNCISVGCFAMTDARIEWIYTFADMAFKKGQKKIPIHIFPFRMTKSNLHKHKQSHWYPFWKNLKEGYDLFEATKCVPHVSYSADCYQFKNTSLY